MGTNSNYPTNCITQLYVYFPTNHWLKTPKKNEAI